MKINASKHPRRQSSEGKARSCIPGGVAWHGESRKRIMASVGAPAKDAGFEGKPEGEEGERSADRVRFIFF